MAAEELSSKGGEALEVIKEDLCQWLSTILKTSITPSTLLDCLDTGVLLCKLAKLTKGAPRAAKYPKVSKVVSCNEKATKESFAARDNASNFISWCRDLGVEEAVIFESEGLVLHKDEKRVILCLLDVARFAERVGIPPPRLVQMEREIEALEVAIPQRKADKSEKSLEERVMSKLKGCTCLPPTNPPSTNPPPTYPPPLKASACGNGKFIINGGNIRGDKTLHARLLSDRIMVRVGGGWDTLEHFLLEHDPCRIKRFVSAHPHLDPQHHNTSDVLWLQRVLAIRARVPGVDLRVCGCNQGVMSRVAENFYAFTTDGDFHGKGLESRGDWNQESASAITSSF